MKRVYLDNAATTPVYPEVTNLMCDMLSNEFGNPSSIHFHGRKARAIIENARKTVAHILNASIGEIFFTGSATESNNAILKGAVESLGVTRIITPATEHPCVLESLSYLRERHKTEIVMLGVDPTGHINPDELENVLADNNKKTLVSIMHGNNEIGTMVDLAQIATLTSKYQTLFHSDTVQTIGKYAIDVSTTKISFLSGSAHKFHGPKGVGFFYMNGDNIIKPFIHGGSQERNIRAGTENVSGIAGLAKALELCTLSMAENQQHILNLRNRLKEGLLSRFKDIRFNGAQDSGFLSHVLNVSFPPSPKADLLVHNLDIAGISCSSASACSSGVEVDSHVLRAIGHDTSRKAIRFSFSAFNTLEDVDFLLEKLVNLTP